MNSQNKPTVIIGASSNPERYSFKATESLKKHGHSVFPIGVKAGEINGTEIINTKIELEDIDTVSLYINSTNQKEWVDYIFKLNPKRIIFNPGTVNDEFIKLATQKGIECVDGCTLVMLGIGVY
jgi:uncharacterized protein